MPRKCTEGDQKEPLSEAVTTTERPKAKENILEATAKKQKDVEMKEHAPVAAKTQKTLLESLTSH